MTKHHKQERKFGAEVLLECATAWHDADMPPVTPTPLTYRVLGRADEIARYMGSPFVGEEHLFLAILHEGKSGLPQVLAGFVDLSQLEEAVTELANASGYDLSNVPPHPELAGFIVANEMGSARVWVGYLLLALIRKPQSIPARALASMASLDEVDAAIVRYTNSLRRSAA